MFSGPFMKASWISRVANTAPMGIVPLVSPFTVVNRSGLTAK